MWSLKSFLLLSPPANCDHGQHDQPQKGQEWPENAHSTHLAASLVIVSSFPFTPRSRPVLSVIPGLTRDLFFHFPAVYLDARGPGSGPGRVKV